MFLKNIYFSTLRRPLSIFFVKKPFILAFEANKCVFYKIALFWIWVHYERSTYLPTIDVFNCLFTEKEINIFAIFQRGNKVRTWNWKKQYLFSSRVCRNLFFDGGYLKKQRWGCLRLGWIITQNCWIFGGKWTKNIYKFGQKSTTRTTREFTYGYVPGSKMRWEYLGIWVTWVPGIKH